MRPYPVSFKFYDISESADLGARGQGTSGPAGRGVGPDCRRRS